MVDAAVVPRWQEVCDWRPEFAARVVATGRLLALDEGTAAVWTPQGWMVAGHGSVVVVEDGRPRSLLAEDVTARSDPPAGAISRHAVG